ncbi:hypothetical protein [Halalkalicoccus subterraneus]|uniref:hypothetical protein n=1 Tax=Halalkalicoccus subterraneus TaxID=2675002 RepID=UPI000EFAC2A9|nr:hypothetical protein [Halalkalicoccus subterraneus]
MSDYSKRQIERMYDEFETKSRVKRQRLGPDGYPAFPDGAEISLPVAIAAARAEQDGADPVEAWVIAGEKGLSNDLPEVTADGLDAVEEVLGYPAEETEELKRSYGLLDEKDESESGE